MFNFRTILLLWIFICTCSFTLTAVRGQNYPSPGYESSQFAGYQPEQNYNRRPYGMGSEEYDDPGYGEEDSRSALSQAHPLAPPVYRPVPVVPEPQSADPNIVMVPRLGNVRGNTRYKYIKNRAVNAFLGIKYGRVDRGLARFQKASAPQYNSNEPIDATHEAPRCPQFPDLQSITEAAARGENVDDCLTLNIYTPNLHDSLPVLVFVHGEMLFDGGAEEGQPDYLLEHDVVLVSINYRLAPFGFLTTLTDEMPGNVALADVQMALEWVQQYIRSFGGNPEAVTLLGQAGGATIVHALSLSGKAQGLFQKLILQSGTALNPYFLDEDPLSTTQTFARIARCSPDTARNPRLLPDCFGRLSTVELLNAFKQHWEQNEPRGLLSTGGFKLVVGDRLGYLPQHPAALVASNTRTSYYPIIAGVTKDAGAFILSRFYDQLKQIRSRNFTEYINTVLGHTAQPRHHRAWLQLARDEIFTIDDERNPTLENLAQGLLELINLILYRGPIVDSLRYASKIQPTFLYCFGYRGEFHRFSHLSSPLPFATDATLSDDSTYLFPYPEEVSRLNPDDSTIARTISAMWADFAINGTLVRSNIWPRVTTEYGPLVRFSNNKDNPIEQDYHFGEGIPVPNLYPEYFTTTTTTTSTTTTTTTTTTPRSYPNYGNQQPQYPYSNPNNYQNRPNYSRENPNTAQPQQQQRPYWAQNNGYQAPNPLRQQYQQEQRPDYSRYNQQSAYQQRHSGDQLRKMRTKYSG